MLHVGNDARQLGGVPVSSFECTLCGQCCGWLRLGGDRGVSLILSQPVLWLLETGWRWGISITFCVEVLGVVFPELVVVQLYRASDGSGNSQGTQAPSTYPVYPGRQSFHPSSEQTCAQCRMEELCYCWCTRSIVSSMYEHLSLIHI